MPTSAGCNPFSLKICAFADCFTSCTMVNVWLFAQQSKSSPCSGRIKVFFNLTFKLCNFSIHSLLALGTIWVAPPSSFQGYTSQIALQWGYKNTSDEAFRLLPLSTHSDDDLSRKARKNWYQNRKLYEPLTSNFPGTVIMIISGIFLVYSAIAVPMQVQKQKSSADLIFCVFLQFFLRSWS